MSSASLKTGGSAPFDTLTVLAPDSTRLVADFVEGSSGIRVLLLPGFWRSRSHPIMRGTTRRLHQAGLSVCTLDNRGHGESRGTFGFDTLEHEDTIAVLEAWQEKDSNKGAISIVGFSAGGAIAISAAAVRPDLVRSLVLVSPVADFRRVRPRPNIFRLDRQLSLRSAIRPPRFWWYEKRRRHPVLDAALVKCRVCLLHAHDDWLVHHSHSTQVASALTSNHEIHVLDALGAHAERFLDTSVDAWNIMTRFLLESRDTGLSGA